TRADQRLDGVEIGTGGSQGGNDFGAFRHSYKVSSTGCDIVVIAKGCRLRKVVGESAQPFYKQGFLPAGLAAYQGDPAFRHPGALGNKADQVVIGLAVGGRRGDLDFETIVVNADNGVTGRLRLQVAVQAKA